MSMYDAVLRFELGGFGMRSVKIGIFGLGRGGDYLKSIMLINGKIVAVCDADSNKLKKAKETVGDGLTTYTDFDSFLNHAGMEAVFICNYFQFVWKYFISCIGFFGSGNKVSSTYI